MGLSSHYNFTDDEKYSFPKCNDTDIKKRFL